MKDKKKQKALEHLLVKRDENIKEVASWLKWEIEEEVQRAKDAKNVFLKKDPNHDLTLIEERIDQLQEGLKLYLKNQKNKSV